MTALDATPAGGAGFHDLKDKVVLITGGGTGIGAALALALGQHGARIALNFKSSEDDARAVASRVNADGGEALLLQGDICSPLTPAHLVTETVAKFGRLDVLVNNAGALVRRALIHEYTDDYLESVLDLNAKQVVRMVHHAAGQMRRQGAIGSIINVSSIAARTGGGPGSALYAAAKGFVLTATRGWARELAPSGIRVNAVSPGVILTPFHERFTSEEQLAAMKATVPMGRLGEADECVGTFLYLASNRASGYVPGQCFEVNGGQYMA